MLLLIDIDECTLGIDLCEHNCFNNFGSYHCACDVGYFLEGNGFNCTGTKLQYSLN